jgi:hypothetical protein
MVVIVELHLMFYFHLKELGQLKGHEVKIILEDGKFIFRRPYSLSEMEHALVQVQIKKIGGIL